MTISKQFIESVENLTMSGQELLKDNYLAICDNEIDRLEKIDVDNLPEKFSLDSCVYGYMTHVEAELYYWAEQREIINNYK